MKESNKRMSFLHKVAKFTKNKQDLKRSTDYDFAAKVYVFAAKFSRLIFNEIASNFLTNSRLFYQAVQNVKI